MMSDSFESLFAHPGYEGYHPIDEVIRAEAYRPKTVKHIFTNSEPKEIDELIEYIKKLGFRKVSARPKIGCNGVILEANNHQMIRIEIDGGERQRIVKDYVLWSLKTFKCGRYNIEILPKIHTLAEIVADKNLARAYEFPEGHERKEAERLIERLTTDMLHDHELLADGKFPNIAIIKNAKGANIPLCLDPGATEDMRVDEELSIRHYYHYAREGDFA